MRQMEDAPVARVDFDEAKTLADLGAIARDLGFTMETCSRLMLLLEQDSDDALLIESLWTVALIRYARCFVSGRRFGLSESVFEELQGDPVETHRY